MTTDREPSPYVPLPIGVCDRCKRGDHARCAMPITKGSCCCDD